MPAFGSDYQRSSTLHGSNTQPKRYVGNVNPAIDCSTPTHLSHTLGPMKPRQVLYEGQAVTSLMSNGHTMTRCLANHYIPDRMMTLDTRVNAPHSAGGFDTINLSPGQMRKHVQEDFRQRFVPEVRRNVMELSERPPMPVPTAVYQMADYPHIVIGGKPFFLIPSSTNTSTADSIIPSGITMGDPSSSSEAYAYPQHMPIYEEIDYNAVNNPVLKQVMDRPLSSTASQSNSAHTNTSELSSNESNSSHHENSHVFQNPNLATPKKRLTESSTAAIIEQRCRSPQSVYSAKMVNSSQKSGQSVYYYTDTLKPRVYANTSMDSDESVELPEVPANNSTIATKKINTKVTLDDPHTSQSGSTLV